MAVLPSRLVDFEFDAGVWTDISADVVDIGTRRGRNRESGAFETGAGVLTLRNDTRKYDPDNTAGTYYGKLRPNRRIRFRGLYNAITYPVMIGYVDRISQVYGGPNAGTAEIDFSDLFKLMNRAELADSVYAAEVAADTPAYWWRLGEPAGSITVLDRIGGRPATRFGTATLGTAGLVTRDSDTAMTQTDQTSGFSLPATGLLTGTQIPVLSIEAIVRYTGTGSTFFSLMGGAGVLFGMNAATGKAVFQLWSGTTSYAAGSPVGDDLRDGAPHHLVGTWDLTSLRLYVDGVLVDTQPATNGPLGSSQELVIGNLSGGFPSGSYAQGMVGDLDEVAVYLAVLTGTRIAAHSSASKTPWNGDLPGTRLGRILDLAAVPATDRNLDAGTTTLQSTNLGGDALSYAQKVEQTELGWLFVTRDGQVRFIGREAGVTGAYLTSKATLVDADSGAGIGYREGVGSDVDEGIMVTRATVSRDGSVAVQYYDAAAKAEFGWLDDTREGLLHNSDAYSFSYAQWLVSVYKNPTSRVGTLTIELAADPANNYPAILGLELGDRVTYKRKPQNVGAVISIDMRVEAIAHATSAGYWRTSLQLSPFNLAGGQPVGVWDVTLWDQCVWGI